jgi:hypothetical protein
MTSPHGFVSIVRGSAPGTTISYVQHTRCAWFSLVQIKKAEDILAASHLKQA